MSSVGLDFVTDEMGLVTAYTTTTNGSLLIRSRVESFNPDQRMLGTYEGMYYSRELETVYTVRLKGDILVASSLAFGDLSLTPRSKDTFTSVWWLPTLQFLRDDEQTIIGFHLNMNRVRNLVFEKVDW